MMHAVESRDGGSVDNFGELAGEEECAGGVCGTWTLIRNRSKDRVDPECGTKQGTRTSRNAPTLRCRVLGGALVLAVR